MKRRRIHALVVFGTRPEAIKLAPVIREFSRRRREFKLAVCATAQHRQLLDQVTHLFRIPVHYDLNIMKPDQKLDQLTAYIMVRVSKILKQSRTLSFCRVTQRRRSSPPWPAFISEFLWRTSKQGCELRGSVCAVS